MTSRGHSRSIRSVSATFIEPMKYKLGISGPRVRLESCTESRRFRLPRVDCAFHEINRCTYCIMHGGKRWLYLGEMNTHPMTKRETRAKG